MKNFLFVLALIFILGDSALATDYLRGWKIYSGGVDNATITETRSKVTLKGNGIKSGYILGAISGADAWHNKRERLLSIYLTNSDVFTIYVPIVTTNGLRYLTYTTHPDHINKRGKEGRFIYVPLDEDEKVVGQSKIIERNLDGDLKRYEPNNKIVEINALMLRGDSEVTNIRFSYLPDNILTGTVYEDGTGSYRWRVYAGGESNGKITSERIVLGGGDVFLPVVSLKGNGIKSGYILGGVDGANAWHNKTDVIVQWKIIRGENPSTVYIPIKTTNGIRYMTYTTHPEHRNKRGKYGRLIYMGRTLGDEVVSFTKNIRQELKKYEPNNTLLEINGFMVRGTTNIRLVVLQKEEAPVSSIFDKEKFTQLLQAKESELKSNGEFENITLHKPVDNIAWFTYEADDGNVNFFDLYTLDKDNKELEAIYQASPNCLVRANVEFLENNTLMHVNLEEDSIVCSNGEDMLYNIEQRSIFETEYSYQPSMN